MLKATSRRTMAMTDIGYSSGENTSVHDDGGTTAIGSEEDNHHHHQPHRQDQAGGENEHQQQLPAVEEFVLAENNELEKSFYRTVPLDEFGHTDMDTDLEGAGPWPRSSYWAQKLMDDAAAAAADTEKEGGEGGGIKLTDSLIVHVDAPELREKLDDFEVQRRGESSSRDSMLLETRC